jgi:hypothetical protein
MNKHLTLICLTAALATLSVPAPARQGAGLDGGDLGSTYLGFWSSTNGDDQLGTITIEVKNTAGNDFVAEWTFISAGPVAVLGGSTFEVEGAVRNNGKLTMSGTPSKGFKFNFAGTLSADAQVITGKYTVKEGRRVAQKGIVGCEED